MPATEQLKYFEFIFHLVKNERFRQMELWGDDHLSHDRFMTILTEEVGEVAHAINEKDWDNYEDELVQVMAVCVRMLQSYYYNTNLKNGFEP